MTYATPQEPLFPQPAGPQRDWNESHFAFWYDVPQGIAGFHRIAQTPNRDLQQIWMGVATSDGVRYRRFSDKVPYLPTDREGRYRVEGLEFEYDPRLLITYRSSDCEVDLSFADLYPPHDNYGLARNSQAGAVRETAGHGHVESSGRVVGTVRIDGRGYTVDGLGHRDHSWGPRDLTGMLSTRWVSGTTGHELSFSLTTIVMADARLFTAGYVVRDTKVIPAVDVDVVLETELDGVSYRGGRATLSLVDGTSVEVVIEDVLDGMLFPTGPYMGVDCACRVSVNGIPGVADFEVVNNAFAGTTLPKLLLRCAVEDGLSRRERSPRREMVGS